MSKFVYTNHLSQVVENLIDVKSTRIDEKRLKRGFFFINLTYYHIKLFLLIFVAKSS